MFALVTAGLMIAAAVIFFVQNAIPISVTFLSWQFSASVAVIVFLAFVTGIAVTALSNLALRFARAARRERKADTLRLTIPPRTRS